MWSVKEEQGMAHLMLYDISKVKPSDKRSISGFMKSLQTSDEKRTFWWKDNMYMYIEYILLK